MRRLLWILLLFSLILLPIQAQDALNLPSELYILTVDGTVQRFGLGSEGITTITPDGEFVIDFRVAPDANWLAYRTQDGLFLSHIFDADEPTRQIEDDRASVPLTRGQGETLAWSPDSSTLAYTTSYGGRLHFFREARFADITTPDLIHLEWSPDGQFLAAEAEGNVWWIFQRNGTALDLRAAIPGANGADWLSNTQILYAPLDGGLSILDLSVGNQQFEILANDSIYYQPSVTRDGQVVAMVGINGSAELFQIEVSDNFVGTATLIGNAAINMDRMRWAPGGFLLTAFRGGVLALVNPITGVGFTLPVSSASAYSWGPEYPALIINQPLPHDVHFIAPDLSGIKQVWVLPADGTRARTITPAPLDIGDYALSPNGQEIAYVSNSILWQYTIGSDDDPQELVMLGLNEGVTPAWSADNSRIYYRDEQDAQVGIWQVSIDAEASLFVADTEDAIFSEPKPALGAGVLLVKRNDEVAIVDTTSGEITPLGIIGDGEWQSGTQFIVMGDAQRENLTGRGLYLGDANTSDTLTLIIPLLGTFELFDYRLVDGILRMLVKNQVPGSVSLLDIPLEGGQARLSGSAGNMVNPRLSPDGLFVIGQRSSEGALLLYNAIDDQIRQIDIAPPITNLEWQP
ncbi:MAG: hypothetical protein WBC91_01985 [Phototrophicaceae bacterium]